MKKLTNNKIMKQYKHILLITFGIIAFTSCQNNSNEVAEETPDAFQNQNIIEEVSSYSKRGYSSLTKIEADIKKLRDNNFEKTKELNKFLANNSKYYRELEHFHNDSIINIKSQITKIKDSTLREQMRIAVEESEKKYKLKTKKLDNILEQLNKKVTELNDYKIAMEISLTLNTIEEYQDNFKQDTTSIKDLIDRYETITKTIKNKIENN